MAYKMYLWIILSLKFTFDILLFHKSIFSKIEQRFMSVYDASYMQSIDHCYKMTYIIWT
jgi:hypothetical protein